MTLRTASDRLWRGVPGHRAPLLLPALLVAAAALTGCSSDDAASEKSPEEVMALASDILVETSGVKLSLTTDDLPDGVTGITSAVGVATQAPAFDGDLEVRLSGVEFEVPVVAVDDTVWARIPLTPGWSDIDPGDYGAPDPAQLISPDHGFATLLQEVEDPVAGEQERGGVDNDEILTEYSGTIEGAVMENVIPSSAGDSFDVVFLVAENGELRRADLTGVFYEGSDEMTYTVGLVDYGTTQEIAAP